MICFEKLPVWSGLDLDFETQTVPSLWAVPAGGGDASRQVRVRAGHGAPATVDVPALRGPLRRRAQGQALLVSGAVLRDGVRAADVSRVAARHRSLPGDAGIAAVSHGISIAGGAQHAGQRQRGAALADLRRSGAAADRHHAAAVCRRADRSGPEGDGLRLRFDHHRPVPVGVPLGAVSLDQGRRQAAYPAGRPPRQTSCRLHRTKNPGAAMAPAPAS
jgi:hypothetical protein